MDAELTKRFTYAHPVSRTAAKRLAQMEALFLEAARKVVRATPASREQSLALTALQEAKHWTAEAIAKNQELLAADEERVLEEAAR